MPVFVKFVQGNSGGAGLRWTMTVYCLDVLFGAAEARKEVLGSFSCLSHLPPTSGVVHSLTGCNLSTLVFSQSICTCMQEFC